MKAAEHLAILLSEDSFLTSMYANALAKFGPERFYKNHDQLLKVFFKDLRSETRSPVQLTTVRGLRNRDQRHKFTSLIQIAFEPFNIKQQEALAILNDQKPDRKQLLNDYLSGGGTVTHINPPAASGANIDHGNIMNPEQDDEPADDEVNSSSSDSNDDMEPISNSSKEKYVHLEPLETFITKGIAFARFKANFRYLLRPPNNLPEALESRDSNIVQRFLDRNFELAASSTYEWLRELNEAGYSKGEIAELLLEDISDSPWIYFNPSEQTRCYIRNDFHVQDCAHGVGFNSAAHSLHPEQKFSHSSLIYADMRRQVEEVWYWRRNSIFASYRYVAW